jgi:hypothetical protein
MVIENTNLFHSKALQKFTQIGMFGLKYIPSGNPAAVFAEKQLFKKTIPHRAIS